MQTKYRSFSDIKTDKDNHVYIGHNNVEMINSEIAFYGTNNYLIVEDGVCLINSSLTFRGDGAIVYISKNRHQVKLSVQVWTNTVLFLDEDVHFTGPLRVAISEEKNVLIGKLCTFAVESTIRTSDAHLIYDCETLNRINPSKSVLIGERVWLGQGTTILKGTHIGSGSIIGTCSVVSNKKIGVNECWGGNPAKLIREGVFWSGVCTHNFTQETAALYQTSRGSFKGITNDKTIAAFIEFDNIDPSSQQLKCRFLANLRNKKNLFNE